MVKKKLFPKLVICIDVCCSLLDQYAGSIPFPVPETIAGNLNFYIRLKEQQQSMTT